MYAVIFSALLSPFCIVLWLYLRTCGWGRKPIRTGEKGEADFPSDILFADAQQPLDTSRASANFLSSYSFVLPRPLPFLASYNALDTVLGVQDLRRHKYDIVPVVRELTTWWREPPGKQRCLLPTFSAPLPLIRTEVFHFPVSFNPPGSWKWMQAKVTDHLQRSCSF